MSKKDDLKEKDVTFYKVDLIENAKNLFNVQPEVLAGALFDVDGDLSVAQAKGKLEEFLSKPIK